MEVEAPIEPLDDPDLKSNPFFGETKSCLVIERPNLILPVRNQGHTHTCYAHAVTASMFGDEVLRVGKSDLASRQEYLDYIHEYKRPKKVIEKYGPSGPYEVPATGFMCSYKVAFGYAAQHWVTPESKYRWVGYPKVNRCDGRKWDGKVKVGDCLIHREEKVSIEGYKRLYTDEEIENHLREQPVAGCIVLTRDLKTWSGVEIFEGEEDKAFHIGKHAITLVGYGHEGGVHYYLCQNSFGLGWGYRGYFKAKRDLILRAYVPITTQSPGERNKEQ